MQIGLTIMVSQSDLWFA